VVSGAAGVIGSHLCERLLEKGHQVVAFDSFLTGSRANLEHLVASPDFQLVEQDVCLPVIVEGLVDLVLHFASPASPIDFPAIPIEIVKVSTLGTHNLLGLALAKGARFLLASTSEVYGDPLEHPQRESYHGNVNPIGPRGCYDEGKRCAEAFTMAYHRAHGLETRIMRIFNTYGPRMRVDDGRVVPNYFSQALRGEPLTVYGDGSQTRSLCYVDDLIRGLYLLATSGEHLPVNIGNPDHEVTMLELAETVIRVTGSSSEVVFEALPTDDPQVRRPDITRARQILGWSPEIDLEEGLRRWLTALGREPVAI
jgi:dTDP-glucose 4,6-dehydratase